MSEHSPVGGKCRECRLAATHRLVEQSLRGFPDVVLCCGCYTLLACGSYKPGRCGEGITLEELLANTESRR